MSSRSPASTVPPTAALKARFARNLIRCRNEADISQEELGFRASLHRTEIGVMERGGRLPRVDTAVRLAGSLGVSLDDLALGLEWKPGYTIVVPGEWEVVERPELAAGNGGEPSATGSPTDLPNHP